MYLSIIAWATATSAYSLLLCRETERALCLYNSSRNTGKSVVRFCGSSTTKNKKNQEDYRSCCWA